MTLTLRTSLRPLVSDHDILVWEGLRETPCDSGITAESLGASQSDA
jgi:hypothetical protein